MRLYSTDDLIIEIYNIRNIESIKIYDIVTQGSSKLMLIPSLLITYDGGKTINLCSRDKYFDIFVKKVVEVYNDEKNNILEDSLSDPFRLRSKIQIDDKTKSILESGTLTEINELYKFYDEKNNYEWSLIFQNDEVNLVIPIIKYHIQQLFSKTDKNIQFSDNYSGYKSTYILNGTIDGLFKYFPLNFDKINDNEYHIEIGGLLESNSPVIINIKFARDSIYVEVSINNYNIKGLYTYLISTDVIKEIQSIKRENILIHYKNRDLSEINNPYESITDFDQTTNLKWFNLPWGAIYGIYTNIENLDEHEKIIQIHNMYVDVIEGSFIKREYYSKNYKKNSISRDVSLDEAIKNTMGICLNKEDGIYLIETAFLDTANKKGYYEEKLKGKYFYHLIESDSIKNIDKYKLVNISQEDGILEDSDILNENLILKLVKEK